MSGQNSTRENREWRKVSIERSYGCKFSNIDETWTQIQETYVDSNNNKPYTWTQLVKLQLTKNKGAQTKYLKRNDSNYNWARKGWKISSKNQENNYQRIICSVKLVEIKLFTRHITTEFLATISLKKYILKGGFQ